MVKRIRLALAMGDAAGVGAEVAAKALAEAAFPEGADILLIGDRRVMEEGCRAAGLPFDMPIVPLERLEAAPAPVEGRLFVDLGHCDPADIPRAAPSAASGRFALANFRTGLRLAREGRADAVAFTPFNKQSMRLAEPDYVDEIGFVSREIGASAEGSEFNVLDEVWNARVTSHVPLGEVAPLITRDRILRSIRLTAETMRAAGHPHARIAVAALNPHAGDGGNFGREEIEIIGPAVEEAKARQLPVDGPFPSDTVYLRALKGEFQAVLTMYHDQGQIAVKLIGFDRGVTLIGGYGFPITTPAHGTAYDIAGRGVANAEATRRALALAARLAREERPAAGT